MNWKPFLALSHTARVVAAVATVFVSLLALSWIAGQCRTWSTPKPPKPVPPIVDPGIPTPGPAATASTVTQPLPIARPQLTLAERKAAAKKYGMTVQPEEKNAAAPLADESINEVDKPQRFPMFLAEETFTHHPSGVSVDVAAWLAGFGQRVDLRAAFHEWQPPTPPKAIVCQSSSFFQNEAKWVKEIGGGVVYGNGKPDFGGWGTVAYRGPKTGAITWGGRGLAAFSQQSGAVGVGGLSISW